MPKQQKKRVRKVATKTKEMTRLGSALRALGGLGGTAIGGLIGMPSAGSSVGSNLGASLSRWLGSGDYTVDSNSIVTQTLKGTDSIPAMHKRGQGITVRHKEYLGSVKGSTGFLVQDVFALNPGSSRTFPWLADIASRFQEYTIKGLVFHYVPTSGTAVSGTNPALGSVMLQTSYRASDTDPASKVEMMNEYWASEAMTTEAFCHPIECAPTENPFKTQYVRTGLVPAGDNILFYDLGRTVLATMGQPASGNVIGDLWVTYEVELRKPVLSSAINSTTSSAAFSCLAPSTTSYFTLTNPTYTGTLPVSLLVRTLTFPKGAIGTFNVSIILIPTSVFTQVDWSSAPSYSNCAAMFLDAYQTFTFAVSAATNGGDSLTSVIYTTNVAITDPSLTASVTFPSLATLTGTALSCNVVISQIA